MRETITTAAAHRSMPSQRRSIAIAVASRPGPLANSASRVVPTTALHNGHPLQRLQCPQQHPGSDAPPLGRNVAHIGCAIDEIDISVPFREEERMIGCGHADECMARGIADRIGLGLDDPTAGSVATVIANEHFADEKTRQLDRVFRQL
jgi:hypothetical protein